MAILSTAKIVGMLACAKRTGKQIKNAAGEWVAEIVEDFVSGFAGHGWKIWEYVSDKWKLEIDSIMVRGTMTVFELLIQKIRAVKGALGITQACGKIKTAGLDADKQNWLITIEDEMSFVSHDIIRCQDWTGSTLKGYWVEISEVKKVNGVDTIVIPVSEFAGGIGYVDGMESVKAGLGDMTTPAVGDEIIQFGNTVNANRQSAVYLHADEGGQPAIDILFGIKSKSFAGCVKQRIGGDIPGTDGLKGFYCENGMIKGVDESGHTVYCIHPDGSAEFGDGSARFDTDKSGYLAGGAIAWQWDDTKQKCVCTMKGVVLTWENLDDAAKENLKGDKGEQGTIGPSGKDGVPGEDANLLPWIEDWNGYATELGADYIVTPKMFSGTKSAEGKLTGIAQGRECLTDAVTGEKRTGIFALVDDEIVFEMDPINKKYKFKGRMEADEGYFVGKIDSAISGKRISINPVDGTFSMINSDGSRMIELSYTGNGFGLIQIKGDKNTGYVDCKLMINGDRISMVHKDGSFDIYPNLIRISSSGKIMELGIGGLSDAGVLYCTEWPDSMDKVDPGAVYSDNGFLKVRPK